MNRFFLMFLEFYQPCVCVLSMWVVIGGSKLFSVFTFLGENCVWECFCVGGLNWSSVIYLFRGVQDLCVWGQGL